MIIVLGCGLAWSQQSGFTTRIGNGSLAQMPAKTVKCNDSSSPANASDCSHIAFFVHKGSTAQTGLTTGAYNLITWPTTKFNSGGGTLASNSYTAPVSGMILLGGHVWCSANCLNTPNSGNPIFVAKLIKNTISTCNGTDIAAGIGAPALGGGTNEAAAAVNAVDQAAVGDNYVLCVFPTSSDSMNDVQIDGNPAHTYWSGAYIR